MHIFKDIYIYGCIHIYIFTHIYTYTYTYLYLNAHIFVPLTKCDMMYIIHYVDMHNGQNLRTILRINSGITIPWWDDYILRTKFCPWDITQTTIIGKNVQSRKHDLPKCGSD